MRHRKNFNHLGRKAGHRKAMLANMASSLILHKRIKTTTAKAKALRMYVEPLISKTKGLDSLVEKTHAQRVVFSYLKDKHAVNELFVEVAPKVEDRPGGYTRIIKLGNRLGDNADMCIIELVDFNELMLADKKVEAQKASGKRRRRRGGGTKPIEATQPVVEEAVAEVAETEAQEVATEKEVEPTTETQAETKEEEKAEPAAEAQAETKEEVETETKEEVKAEAAEDAQSEEEEKKEDSQEKKEETDRKEE